MKQSYKIFTDKKDENDFFSECRKQGIAMLWGTIKNKEALVHWDLQTLYGGKLPEGNRMYSHWSVGVLNKSEFDIRSFYRNYIKTSSVFAKEKEHMIGGHNSGLFLVAKEDINSTLLDISEMIEKIVKSDSIKVTISITNASEKTKISKTFKLSEQYKKENTF